MDYSKVNNALSGWVGSSTKRDRAKAELGQAMEMMQAQNQLQQNRQAKEQEMDNWMAHIHNMASQVAVRNEDREKIQAMYGQEKETFLAELEKAGNDPVKFMNSGGRKTMQNFYNNIAFSDDAKRIQGNTKEIQQFYEQLEGSDGKNANLIPLQVRREFDAFMNGDIDSFKHRTLGKWADPGDDTPGHSIADKYLNADDNSYMTWMSNYINEYDLSPGAVDNISRDQLENYVAQYVGGGDRQKALQPIVAGTSVSKSSAAMVTRQHRRMKPVSTSVIGSNSQEYMSAIRDYDSGGFEYGVGPENSDVVGNRGFVGDELHIAQAMHGKENILDLENYVPDMQAIGTWYNEDGEGLRGGEDLGDGLKYSKEKRFKDKDK